MTITALTFALIALLATPGPTNMVLLIAASERGFLKACHLLAVVLSAYLATIIPLSFGGGHVLAYLPGLKPLVAVLAGIWVARLAVKLWQRPAEGQASPAVTNRAVFTTTLLNPKALIIGIVLMPAQTAWVTATNILLFVSVATLASLVWLAAGQVVARGNPGGPPLGFRRAAAVWLGMIAIMLVLRGIGATAQMTTA